MWRFPGRRESDVGNYFTLDLTDTERKVNGDYSNLQFRHGTRYHR